ncbi:short-chain dehydrogenase/reductase SDR [Pseudoxanthomonas suwonensis 11-1]|uniref:Short-chain dehydrogenase/reductase SDR n=1 Tax=Pseudoxanthomonas suwonensis (strain 11-1) TaxID=743721 RepID=E6WWZ4_PSEUU|nr:SDR family oxidoreductase [Pseudoxanthomonas suwonensis]ADV28693.1 short-chain dehydrogenase/reductase SDR [Pseudoxanthomonas suwonensis 11-1]
MAQHKPLDQQVIVVTGASSGIGLCTALSAAEQGARVVLAARSLDVLQEAVATITSAGGQALAAQCDVSRREDVDAVARLAHQRFGGIDTWVNNAGVSIYGRLEEVSEEDSRRLFDINFWGVVNGSLAALPFLRASGGVLVNLGSEVSDAVLPLQGMYAASKHAVKGFTDALRVEEERVDDSPVSIVLVQPTATDTPFPQHARNYMDREPKLPSPMIEPSRVAAAILHAATHGGRATQVGAMSKFNSLASRLAPALAERMAALQAGRQQLDAPPLDPRGTLDQPGHAGRIHGELS